MINEFLDLYHIFKIYPTTFNFRAKKTAKTLIPIVKYPTTSKPAKVPSAFSVINSPAAKEPNNKPASRKEERTDIKLPRVSGVTTDVTIVVEGTVRPLDATKKEEVTTKAIGIETGGKLVIA